MSLPDRLHCPACQGRLSFTTQTELRCVQCDRLIPVAGGVADFVAASVTPGQGGDRYRGLLQAHGLLASNLPARIKHAAGTRWPVVLGDTIEFGCGLGSITQAILVNEVMRSLLVLDTDMHLLQACQERIATLDGNGPCSVTFAALGGDQNAVRDAVADTVIGSVVLPGIGDVRGFLSMVYRALKPAGRALFVVPNRRCHQAICLAMAEALTQQFARHGVWPDNCEAAMRRVAELRLSLVDRDDHPRLIPPEDQPLFDSGTLEAMGEQIGYETAEMIPLDPDPVGVATITRVCLDAGASDAFAAVFGPLAATIGRPFLSLLSPRDASAFSLFWLTKPAGPMVRVYAGSPAEPVVVYPGPDEALGGAPPRWSLELLGRDTQEGIMVKIGGWCLSNIDALDVRVTLDDSVRSTPIWRHRPDVHDVLNRSRVYHALNALCSGIDDELLFAGIHPTEAGCEFGIEIVLAGGLTVRGPAPDRLLMDQPVVIAL
jgi:SAM-dependent methyltransferase